ncbi:putative replicase [Circoviridae bovine stool/BK/KOR/2011]|uniref:Putative replicase n=1 Tax=Circoviridae bovine stool/BK/KOR/2011 TaxID=1127491 RepID=H6UDU6_9VIRU|nr:putative replicase [Circoviridae bovine stool/BK/KOR/2011]AEW47007.1 putative replicase [Circoviridae bovine stool/BK/KOR/2011]
MKYVATISRTSIPEHHLVRLLKLLDLHEAYIGRETGARGFEHYQCCIDCAGDLVRFNTEHQLGWHIEECVSWEASKNYCRKTDNYRYVGDSIEEREYSRIATRPKNIVADRIQFHIDHRNDRAISICVDTIGGTGKSTYGYLCARRGQFFVVPRTAETPTRIMDYIAMHYDNQPVIWIDLPRSRLVDKDLAECLEDIKDGLVASAKYEGCLRFIRGVKVLVTTNHWVDKTTYKMLSADRWDIFTALPSTEGESSR